MIGGAVHLLCSTGMCECTHVMVDRKQSLLGCVVQTMFTLTGLPTTSKMLYLQLTYMREVWFSIMGTTRHRMPCPVAHHGSAGAFLCPAPFPLPPTPLNRGGWMRELTHGALKTRQW